MRRALAAGALLIVLAACGSDDRALRVTTERANAGNMAESALVDSVQCTSDERGAVASGTLQNVSDETHAYEVVVEFYDRGHEFYTGASERTADLPPDVTTLWAAVPDTPLAAGGTCEVVDVVELVPGGEATAFPTDGSPTSLPLTEATQTTYPVPIDGN